MRLLSLAAVAASVASAAATAWTLDGGSPTRSSTYNIQDPLTAVKAHTTYKFASNVEDTVSEVEEYLLQSPLVTSFGMVLVVNDLCTMSLLRDPVNLPASNAWAPLTGASWTPTSYANEEKSFAGVALDLQDIAYLLDRRNRALHAVQLSATAPMFKELWAVELNVSHHLAFDDDVSMLPVPSINELWVPLRGTMLGSEGVAVVVQMGAGSGGAHAVVPLPPKTPECSYPEDAGSVVTAMPRGESAVALLLGRGCGLQIVSATAPYPYVYSSLPARDREFAHGQHSHPVFDAATAQTYYLDWQPQPYMHQLLCCLASGNGYATCKGWPGECVMIPELSSTTGPEGPYYYAWEWLALSVLSGNIYIAASAPAKDGVFISSDDDLFSALFVFDATSASLIATHRFADDMFNSAPLAVVPAGNPAAAKVFVSTTRGYLYAYAGGAAVGNGPLWTSRDISPIPEEDLPASTFSYLTPLPSGTILVTASAGGANWKTQKMHHAIVNAMFQPSGSPAAGLSPGAKAGVAIGVLSGLGILFAVAFNMSPSFAAAVRRGASSAASACVSLRGAGSYSKVTGPTGSGAEGSSLLRTGAAAPVSASGTYNAGGAPF